MSKAYECAQKFSPEAVEEIIMPKIPAKKKKREYIAVFYNDKEIRLANKPIYDKDTFFVMPEPVLAAAGVDTVIDGDLIEITGKNLKARFSVGSTTGDKNGKKVLINTAPEIKNKTLMVPLNLINCVLDAKVWYDEHGKMIVISTGKYKDDNIMRIVGGKLYMNGEPYYEISFNKFDITMQISAEYIYFHEFPSPEFQYAAAEDAMKKLHDWGFHSIRLFMGSSTRNGILTDMEKRARYFEVMDRIFDLMDKYDIQIVPCMSLISGDFIAEGENQWNLICEKNSDSRKNLKEFIKLFVERYGKRKTVLMWESDNENNLGCDVGIQIGRNCPSIREIGDFYEDVRATFKKYDPDRLFTGGDSIFRHEQWHLYEGVKKGMDVSNWVRDTLEDRMKAYVLLDRAVDVISMHTYGVGKSNDTYSVSDEDKTQVKLDFNLLMAECERMGKPFYNGETAINADDTDSFTIAENKAFLDSMIDAGVQLTHWWTFHCDRQGFHDGYGWDLTYGPILENIIDANRKIKEIYCTNGVEGENTY